MEPININIRITLDAEQRLIGALESLLGRSVPVILEAAPTQPQADCMRCDDLPFDQKAETAAQQEQPIQAEPVQAAPAEAPAERRTDKDIILEVIDRTRRRIQGDDYKTNDSAECKKIGRMLTAEFKAIAMTLAASMGKQQQILEKDKNGNDIVKPTRLPEIGAEIAFARSCEELRLVDGKIVADSAF